MSVDDGAGATRVWFGKHRGEQLDHLPYSYRLWAVYSDEAQENQWHAKFEELHYRCLDEERPHLSTDDRPGNIVTDWSEQRPFYMVYQDKGKMRRWKEKFYGKWLWELLDLTWQYEAWLADHSRGPRPRQAESVKRDIGRKCGPWDDKKDAVPENDQYDSNDPFIDDSEQNEADDDDYVPSDEEEDGAEDRKRRITEDETGILSSGDVGVVESEDEGESEDSEDFINDAASADHSDSSNSEDALPRVKERRRVYRMREVEGLSDDDSIVEATPPLSQASQSTSSLRHASYGPTTPESVLSSRSSDPSPKRRRRTERAPSSTSSISSLCARPQQKRRFETVPKGISSDSDEEDDTPIVILAKRWRQAK